MALMTKATDERALPVSERPATREARARWDEAKAALDALQARELEILAIAGDGRTVRTGPAPSEDNIDRATEERPEIAAKLSRARRACRTAEAAYRALVDETTATVLAERAEARRALARRVFEVAEALAAAVSALELFDQQTAVLTGGRRPECPFPAFLPSTPAAENLVDFRRRIFEAEL